MQNTSVRLIYYTKSPTDSKKSFPDMKYLNIISNSPTHFPNITEISVAEISVATEISNQFDLHTIIEFQIYSLVLPILQAILGKNVAKTL